VRSILRGSSHQGFSPTISGRDFEEEEEEVKEEEEEDCGNEGEDDDDDEEGRLEDED
jgi:hypothetical protein